MRVGIIGLGSIAKKAYLPVITAMPGVTPVLVSRNPRTLATVGAAYRTPDRFESVQDAISSGLDSAGAHTLRDAPRDRRGPASQRRAGARRQAARHRSRDGARPGLAGGPVGRLPDGRLQSSLRTGLPRSGPRSHPWPGPRRGPPSRVFSRLRQAGRPFGSHRAGLRTGYPNRT